MGERLGKIAEHLSGGTDLLSVEAHSIPIGEHLLQLQASLFKIAAPGQCIG